MNDDQAKQILRRLENIEKTQKIQFSDRNILEDIQLSIQSLKNEVKLLTDRVYSLEKNSKADAKDVLSEVQKVSDNVEELNKMTN